jgi:DNA-binding transcriptional LysR family regulator
VDLQDLRSFSAVAGEGSVSRAATRLHLSQPALSRRMSDLETELQVALLDRHRSGVAPTPAGTDFLEGARRVLAQVDAAIERAREAAQGVRGKLVLGVGRTSLWQDVIQRAMTLVRAHLPTLEIELREIEAGPQQWKRLAEGEIDLAIGLHPPTHLTHLAADPIFDATLDCALLPRSSPLAGREQLRPEDLRQVPLLWGKRELHADLTDRLLDALARSGIRSEMRYEYSGPHAIWLAVASGAGWSPVPAFLREWAPDGTVAVPVPGLSVSLTNSAIWRHDEERPVVLTVVEALRAYRDGRPLPDISAGNHGRPRRAAKGKGARAIDVPELRALVAAVREEGLGRAAETLEVTQPALSRQIQGLERAVGTPLLERLPRGVRATAAGHSLAVDAERVLVAIDGLRGELTRAHRAALGRCLAGTVEAASHDETVGRIIATITSRNPALRFSTERLTTPAQVDALLAGRIDIGFGHIDAGAEDDTHIARLVLTKDVVAVALLAADAPLARRANVSVADLAPLPWLFVTEAFEPVLYGRVMRALERLKLRPEAVVAYPGFQTIWTHLPMVQGWTLGLARHRKHPPAGLVAVPVRGLRIPWGVELLWRRDERRADVLGVVKVAREVVSRKK